MRRILLKLLPYLTSIFCGLMLLYIGLKLNQDMKGLFINITAGFLSIPLIYLFYQLAHNLSQKRLNKEIFEFTKLQIYGDITLIALELQKILYPAKWDNYRASDNEEVLSLSENEIKQIIFNNRYLGMQAYKKREFHDNNLINAMENPFLHSILGNEYIIHIIHIVQSISNLRNFQNVDFLYTPVETKLTSFKMSDTDKGLDEDNFIYTKRFLLLKDLEGDETHILNPDDYTVWDANKLLQVFVINEKMRDIYIAAILDLIKRLKSWLDLTGAKLDNEMSSTTLIYNDSKTHLHR